MLNYYTYQAMKLGIKGSMPRHVAPFFPRMNHYLAYFIQGKPLVTLYSASRTTYMGRYWQNQAIIESLVGFGTSFSLGYYGMSNNIDYPGTSNIRSALYLQMPEYPEEKQPSEGSGFIPVGAMVPWESKL